MGRSNAVILVLGLGTCLALSLLLRTGLKLSAEKGIPPVVVEIREQFGRQLESAPTFRVEATPRGAVGYLQVRPLLNSGAERLALSLGQYLWRCCAREAGLVALVVSCEFEAGRVERFSVNPPRRPGRAIRRLGPEESPDLAVVRTASPKRPSSRQSAAGKRP